MVFGVTLVVFFMVHLLPGNPALTLLGQTATPDAGRRAATSSSGSTSRSGGSTASSSGTC